MKKWLRRTLIASVVFGLTLAALYEAATHVGRGWLRGEAFYEGRPTSYWCCKIDEWMERFDSVDDAVRWFDWVAIGPNDNGIRDIELDPAGMAVWPKAPKARNQSWITKMLDSVHPEEQNNRDLPPKVLCGWPGSERMASELAQTARFRLLVERGQRNARPVPVFRAGRDSGELEFILD